MMAKELHVESPDSPVLDIVKKGMGIKVTVLNF